jgi:anti-sigma factor RsiW
MKVTRDVVYDLLPAYFAGEVSADTRALIKEFLATDPEFGRMAEKFGALMEERSRRGSEATDADRERTTLNRAIRRSKLRQSSMAWALGAVLAVVIAGLTPVGGRVGMRHPGNIIAVVFGAMALTTWLASYRPDSGRWYGSFSRSED